MTYKLKNGEEIRNGKLYGWTGCPCPKCNGTGDSFNEYQHCCGSCAGTGEEWGLMPTQPPDMEAAE